MILSQPSIVGNEQFDCAVASLIWNRNTITDITMLRAPTVAYSVRAGDGPSPRLDPYATSSLPTRTGRSYSSRPCTRGSLIHSGYGAEFGGMDCHDAKERDRILE